MNSEIISAKHIKDYQIEITFKDRKVQTVDFEAFLKERENWDAIKPYLNLKEFKEFKIVDGNLNWNDHDLIFAPGSLYNNDLEGNYCD